MFVTGCSLKLLRAESLTKGKEMYQNHVIIAHMTFQLLLAIDSQDTQQLIHHQNISTDENRLSTQGVSLSVPSPIVQQQRLSEISE